MIVVNPNTINIQALKTYLRLILAFYRSFYVTSVLVTLICAWFAYVEGMDILSGLLMFKLFANAVIIYVINIFKKKEFYYYQNLGLTKKRLWIYTLLLDFLIFVLLIATLLWIR